MKFFIQVLELCRKNLKLCKINGTILSDKCQKQLGCVTRVLKSFKRFEKHVLIVLKKIFLGVVKKFFYIHLLLDGTER